MTSLLEKFISVIAPHRCISCSKENNVVCDLCLPDLFAEIYDGCYICGLPTIDAKPCTSCQPTTTLSHVWVTGTYDEQIRELIRRYKFSRVRSAYQPLATALDTLVPYFDQRVVVVPIPTASRHIRVRGYDHAALMARELARRRGWRYEPVLRRRHSLRQVGASKAVRARQASTAFELVRPERLHGSMVLLVDDVTTSGATLTAAAAQIAKASPQDVQAAVVAKHILS